MGVKFSLYFKNSYLGFKKSIKIINIFHLNNHKIILEQKKPLNLRRITIKNDPQRCNKIFNKMSCPQIKEKIFLNCIKRPVLELASPKC